MLKKAISILCVSVILFSFASCSQGRKYASMSAEEITKAIENDEVWTLYAHYSVKNTEIFKNYLYVQFDSSLEDRPFYSPDSTKIEFYGKKVIYNKDGSVADESKINYGDPLLIVYDGTVKSEKDPVTVKAIRVVLDK